MSSRGIALIAVALALSAGLIGLQLASGAADFVPQRPADPCRDRDRTVKPELEAVAEAVVLKGLDAAACELGVSRERLLLALPSENDRARLAREAGTDERGIDRAIEDGLRSGIDRLDKAGELPSAAALASSVADRLGIPERLLDLIPDGLLDRLPETADVLRWSLDKIDVNTILANLEDGKSLEAALRDALVQGAIAAIKDEIGVGPG